MIHYLEKREMVGSQKMNEETEIDLVPHRRPFSMSLTATAFILSKMHFWSLIITEVLEEKH